LADAVTAANETVAQLGGRLDARVCELVTSRLRVAADLSRIVCAVRIGADVEKMADLAARIAQVARCGIRTVRSPPRSRRLWLGWDTSPRRWPRRPPL
jgi:phosphate transport system protein